MSETAMNKLAVVTGASKGIGKACALELARRGYDIAVNYRSDEDSAARTVAEIEALGQKAVAYRADTADIGAVKQMFRSIVKEMRTPDVLVNNAGIVDDAYLLLINEQSLDRSLNVNIKGYINCAQQAALKMYSRKKGVIINISSVSSVLAVAGQTVYSATKGAVNSMTSVMAKELAPKGIRVNAVAPGFIDTEMMKSIPDDLKTQYLAEIPLSRFGDAAEVGKVVAALCSEDFAYLTGQTLILDGGLSL